MTTLKTEYVVKIQRHLYFYPRITKKNNKMCINLNQLNIKNIKHFNICFSCVNWKIYVSKEVPKKWQKIFFDAFILTLFKRREIESCQKFGSLHLHILSRRFFFRNSKCEEEAISQISSSSNNTDIFFKRLK
jgi:hypothetical protein